MKNLTSLARRIIMKMSSTEAAFYRSARPFDRKVIKPRSSAPGMRAQNIMRKNTLQLAARVFYILIISAPLKKLI
jgi:hypothetical protein